MNLVLFRTEKRNEVEGLSINLQLGGRLRANYFWVLCLQPELIHGFLRYFLNIYLERSALCSEITCHKNCTLAAGNSPMWASVHLAGTYRDPMWLHPVWITNLSDGRNQRYSPRKYGCWHTWENNMLLFYLRERSLICPTQSFLSTYWKKFRKLQKWSIPISNLGSNLF